MKKVLLTAAMAATVAISASAQGISIGPRFGVTSTTWSASKGTNEERKDFNDNVKYKIGVFGGLVLNAALTESFSIQPELLYVTQGYQHEFDEDLGGGNDYSVKTKFSTSNLQLPILAKITFGEGDLKFFVNAGPYASYWMTGEIDHKVSVNGEEVVEDSFKESIKFNDDEDGNGYRRMDYGIAAGGGLGYMAGPGMLTLDFRYNYGLSDTFKYKADRPSDFSKYSNRVFSLSVGYLFGSGN